VVNQPSLFDEFFDEFHFSFDFCFRFDGPDHFLEAFLEAGCVWCRFQWLVGPLKNLFDADSDEKVVGVVGDVVVSFDADSNEKVVGVF
jgi:hypothetical protein